MIQSFDFIFNFRSYPAAACISEKSGCVYGKHVERILKHPRALLLVKLVLARLVENSVPLFLQCMEYGFGDDLIQADVLTISMRCYNASEMMGCLLD